MTATARTGRRAAVSGARSLASMAAGVALTIAFWSWLSRRLDPVQLPPPGKVWQALRDGWRGIDALEFVGFQTGGIRDGLIYTSRNVIIGASIGTVLGVFAGVLIGASRTTAAVLGPPLLILGATPVLVILPFILIWFGPTSVGQSLLVVFFTFVTVAAVTQHAVTNVGDHYRNFGACLGANRRQVLWHVTSPAVVPAVIGAVRVSVAMDWSYATVAELLGGQRGTGKIIQAMAQLQRTADVIAVVLSIAAVAVVVDWVIATAGRWIVRWQE